MERLEAIIDAHTWKALPARNASRDGRGVRLGESKTLRRARAGIEGERKREAGCRAESSERLLGQYQRTGVED